MSDDDIYPQPLVMSERQREFFAAVDKARDEGEPAPYRRAAEITGTPYPTAYRWKNEFDDLLPKLVFPTSNNCAAYDFADITLNEPSLTDAKIISAFKFLAWMRSSDDPVLATTIFALMVINYSRQRDEVGTFGEMRPAFLSELNSVFNLEHLSSLLHPYCRMQPIYRKTGREQDRSGRDYHSVIAKITHYLLSEPVSRRTKDNLNGAFHYLQSRHSGIGYAVTRKWTRIVWLRYSQVAPFVYLIRADPSLNCFFDAVGFDFSRAVDAWLADREKLIAFLSRALWITDVLRTQLTTRQLRDAALPEFPKKLIPLPCAQPLREDLEASVIQPSL